MDSSSRFFVADMPCPSRLPLEGVISRPYGHLEFEATGGRSLLFMLLHGRFEKLACLNTFFRGSYRMNAFAFSGR